VRTWLTVACIPASLYCVQNLATLVAYQSLEPLTFNVLNQTKTLSAALCCYLVMGRMQSSVQVIALLLLFFSACVIEKIVPLTTTPKKTTPASATPSTSTPSTATSPPNTQHARGVLAVLLASFLSGLAGALTQNNLQSTTALITGSRNSYFFTMELSFACILLLSASLPFSADGKRVRTEGFFSGWTPRTILPVLTNAAGGIVVGLVTKHAGAVRKGFALIFGLSREQVVGGGLAALSLWMHSAYPV